MSLPHRDRSPDASPSVPPAASDSIDSLVDAVSAGARPSLSGLSDTAEGGAVPLTALPRDASRRRGASPFVRRTALAASAFGFGLALAIWGLRSFDRADRDRANLDHAQQDRTNLDRAERPLPSRALWPPTRMARPQASALSAEDLIAARGLPEIVDTPTPAPPPAIERLVAAPAPSRATARRSPLPSPTAAPVEAPPLDATALVAEAPAPVVPLPERPARAETIATTATTATSTSVEAAEETAILGTVQEYERAFEQLDVNATAELWPSVDRRALSRAFSAIKSQELSLESCNVMLADTTATARCYGTSQYVVKIGGAGARTGRFEWIFRMRKLGNLWKIDGVTAFEQAAASRDQQ